MKNAPNSKTNLYRAILRFAGDVARSNDLRRLNTWHGEGGKESVAFVFKHIAPAS